MKKEKRRFVIREKNLKKKKKKHVAIFLTRSVVEIRSSICGFFYFFFLFSFFSPLFFFYFIKLEQGNVSLCRSVNLSISRPFVALFVALQPPLYYIVAFFYEMSAICKNRMGNFTKKKRKKKKTNATCFYYILTISPSHAIKRFDLEAIRKWGETIIRIE